jgi:starvation-inducible outer membrane lipoprotein
MATIRAQPMSQQHYDEFGNIKNERHVTPSRVGGVIYNLTFTSKEALLETQEPNFPLAKLVRYNLNKANDAPTVSTFAGTFYATNYFAGITRD